MMYVPPNPNQPNPWLKHQVNQPPEPSSSASLIEYLRWMRIQRMNENSDSQSALLNNGEFLELLDTFERTYDYSETLQRLCDRTRRLAHETFTARSLWRIRVGGMRGPESMLLPAFDALGMPYIPSTTLKGVARSVAERSATDADIRYLFGEIEPTATMGGVIFLDAYPLPFQEVDSDDEREGLVPDMANSIWTWQHDSPQYRTNPNVFFSLRKPTFVIGLRRGQNLASDSDALERVKQWLIQGLSEGIGSRVNSGYGVLTAHSQEPIQEKRILEVKFQLRGQLTHGRQTFRSWQQRDDGTWKPPGLAQPEVRPPAFRSMLRYWFRTLALGVLEPQLVKTWELKIFGGFDDADPRLGVFQLIISDGVIRQDNVQKAEAGCSTGTLILRRSLGMQSLSPDQRTACTKLLSYLTWLMVQFGGVGQGARRPNYDRSDRGAPYWRGSTLLVQSEDEFWRSPAVFREPQVPVQKRLEAFYRYLGELTGQPIALQADALRFAPFSGSWAEAIDLNCKILYVQGTLSRNKPPALAVLHKLARRGNGYDSQLCGTIQERSPIWISHVGFRKVSNLHHNIVIVFGADNARRSEYIQQLEQLNSPITTCQTIWPLPNSQQAEI